MKTAVYQFGGKHVDSDFLRLADMSFVVKNSDSVFGFPVLGRADVRDDQTHQCSVGNADVKEAASLAETELIGRLSLFGKASPDDLDFQGKGLPQQKMLALVRNGQHIHIAGKTHLGCQQVRRNRRCNQYATEGHTLVLGVRVQSSVNLPEQLSFGQKLNDHRNLGMRFDGALGQCADFLSVPQYDGTTCDWVSY